MQTPNAANPVSARHVVTGMNEDNELTVLAVVVVSDMVPEGRPVRVEGHHTDTGTPEVLVGPKAYERIAEEDGWVE